ncbi:choice-of-anchor M domain-containing protein [Allonocardiopsis opalescens]|uniref:Surface-anchored protein n=1 Tax=Allonocardiopsis opalescens TaxID=1144618 RepID=A0A2T0Q2C2_9ACTN|nr:choice-of-anchor M domain-containing protein [Allonocardiopsis opalescens]PRX97949.1 surface-anchored protein [Allonocardiopsis opalescens]
MSAGAPAALGRRLGAALALGGLALAATALAPMAGADAQPVPDDTVVLADGHVDVAARFVDGALRMQVGDGTRPGGTVWRELDTVVFHAAPESQITVPNRADWSFIGEPGATVWNLPMTQLDGVLWPGWNSEELRSAEVTGPVRWTLGQVSGPGDFALFTTSPFGAPNILFSTHDGVPDTMSFPTGTHAHGNWVFTEPGVYRLGFEMAVTLSSGATASDSGTLAVAVGDVDPGTVVPGDGGPTEDPSPSPTPDPGPDPSEPGPDPSDDPTGPPGEPTGPIVLDQGHIDLAAVPDGNGIDIRIKDGTRSITDPEWHRPDEVVWHARPRSRTEVPDNPAFAFLGSPGDPVWLLPQIQDAELLWPGWNSEEFAPGDLAGDLEWELTAARGPGAFALYQDGALGDTDVVFDSDDALPQARAVPPGTHAHGNWAFGAEGVYRLTFTMSGRTPSGVEVSDTDTIAIAVGDVDPGTVVPGDGGDPPPTPDPTGDPDPSPDPSPSQPPGGTPPPGAAPPPGGGPGPQPAGGGSTLPVTGAALVGVALAGAALAAGGAGLLAASRRRRASPAHGADDPPSEGGASRAAG